MKFEAMMVTIILVGFIGLLFSISLGKQQSEEKDLAKYQECKQKTSDIEWCFNQFRPVIK